MSGVLKAGPAVPNWLAGTLVGLVLGGVLGFYGQEWLGRPAGADNNAPAGGGGMMAGGGPGGPGGGGMMGGGGGGGAQDHPNAALLVRTVGALATLDAARGRELSAEQRQKVAALAAKLKSDEALTEEQAEAHLTALQGALSEEQRTLLEAMTARPGGGRGGGMGGTPGGGMMGGGTPGGNRPAGPGGPAPAPPTSMSFGGGGGGFGGQQTDWERPFKEGRARDRLDELAASLAR